MKKKANTTKGKPFLPGAFYILIIFLFSMLACTRDDEILPPMNDDYLSIPDRNFETILLEQGIDSDGMLNQKIWKTDAEKVDQLHINSENPASAINELTGIEGFVNLIDLSAEGHNLETIDLRHNTKLEQLSLQANYLTSLDLSHQPNLTVVNVSVNELRLIKGLDQAINLKRLNLSWNNLESIAVNHPSLEVLMLDHNRLRSFEARGTARLKDVLISSNELSTLDFSSSPLLKTLIVSDNKLQNINLEIHRSLEYFYASSNLLSSLDVSNNEKLVDLRVDRNPNLTCIKIQPDQEILTVSIADYQELNSYCE